MAKSAPKIFILDIARGICALIVASYHFIHFKTPKGSLFNFDPSFQQTFDPIILGIVGVFFFISGYVLFLHLERSDYKLSDFGRFMLKRVIRLQLPLLGCIAALLAIKAMFQLNLGEPLDFSISQFLANISLTANFVGEEWYNPIFWTLSIELQFYIFIGLSFLLIRKHTFFWLFGLGVLSLLMNYYLDTRGTLVEYASYFTIGICMYLFHQNRCKLYHVLIITAIGIYDFHLNQAPFFFISSMLFVPLILFVKKGYKPFEFIGEISFSFYLMHGAIGGTFLYFTTRYFDEAWQKIGLILIAIVISYIGSYIFYRIVEKLSIRIVRSIRYKRN